MTQARAARRWWHAKALLLALFCLVWPSTVHAQRPKLDKGSQRAPLVMRAQATPTEVVVKLVNRGTGPLRDVRTTVTVGSKRHELEPVGSLEPEAEAERRVAIALPEAKGSYAVVSHVGYLDGARRRVAMHASAVGETTATIEGRPVMRTVVLREQGYLEMQHDKRYRARLVAPELVEVLSQKPSAKGTRFLLRNLQPTRQDNHPIIGVLETPEGEAEHAAVVVRGRVSARKVMKASSRFPPNLLLGIGLAGLIFAFVLYRRRNPEEQEKPAERDIALIRWSFSVATVSLLFWAFRTAYVVPDWLFTELSASSFPKGAIGRFGWRALHAVANRLYFEGGDYDHYSRYVLDPLYLYMLVGNYFVLRWMIRPDPATDKYWHLLKSTFSLATLFSSERKLFWSPKSKIAVLTLMVKIFYVPMLCSWTISNVFHQQNLITNFSWDFYALQKFSVAALIFVDVAIFTFGYLVELPQLKNQIRTVEPTVLGWVVCVMCYPPFNSFSFMPFQYNLFDTFDPVSQNSFWGRWALSLTAILWFFYTWASWALGPRASNLTNRGIVKTGPYAYVRHPAYASKVSLWALTALFFGDRAFFMVLGLAFIYGLRAWTEERHLGMDPDYVEYKEEVPYRFIPWVI
jgi:protein-S-isoprenylcysteine O-methyltransferase Ste14